MSPELRAALAAAFTALPSPGAQGFAPWMRDLIRAVMREPEPVPLTPAQVNAGELLFAIKWINDLRDGKAETSDEALALAACRRAIALAEGKQP